MPQLLLAFGFGVLATLLVGVLVFACAGGIGVAAAGAGSADDPLEAADQADARKAALMDLIRGQQQAEESRLREELAGTSPA